jgi:hypothetical protein
VADSKGSWDATEEAMESQGSSTFLRLAGDGDKAVVALCGAPFHRAICFNEKTNTYEPWDDAAKSAGRRKTSRYAINAFVVSLKGKPVGEMRVLEMNFNTITTVVGLRDKYGFGKYLFEITRHGAANDTKTTYQILPDKEITAEQRALFGVVDPNNRNKWNEGTIGMIDLEAATARDEGVDRGDATVTDDVKKGGGDKKAGAGRAAPPAASAAAASTNGTTGAAAAAPAATAAAASGAVAAAPTISKEAIAVIVEKLKPLDRDKGVGPLLAQFPYAKKVSEILARDEAAAIALANKIAAPPAAPAAEDPFA